MSRFRDGIRVATTVFEAAAWHECVRIGCACGHTAYHDPHGLWWFCERRGWNDEFRNLPRFYCLRCMILHRRKVRPTFIEAQKATPTIIFPMPDERAWKRALRRYKT